MLLKGVIGSDVVNLILMGGPSEDVVGAAHDWSECLHILAAFCQFLLAWLLLCAWPQPIGLLAATYFVVWLVAWRECLFAFPMLGVGGSRR